MEEQIGQTKETNIEYHPENKQLIPDELLGPSDMQLDDLARAEMRTANLHEIIKRAEKVKMPVETIRKLQFEGISMAGLHDLIARERYGFLWEDAKKLLECIGNTTPLGIIMVEDRKPVPRVRAGALITPNGWTWTKIESRQKDNKWDWGFSVEEIDQVTGLHLLDTELAKHGLRLETGSGGGVNRVTPTPPAQQTS